MKISLSFAEYAAVNSIREVGSAAFALLAAAKLAKEGNTRTWIIEGEEEGFGALLDDVNRAQRKTLSSTMSAALESVCSAIGNISQ